MYAVVSTGGKQLKVEKDTVEVVEKLDAQPGDLVTLDVLFVADGDSVVTDQKSLATATVTAEVVEHFKGEKKIVFKFKKRKGYKRLKGHRQQQTRIRIKDISLIGGSKPTAKTEVVAAPKAPAKKAAKPAPKAAKDETAPAAEVAVAQCEAIKSNGERCNNKAKDGSAYCGVHAKKYDA
jgi:large subunit ribosomal protein L21